MLPLTIHPIWQFLLLIAAIPVFSLITLLIGLYIQSGRKDDRRNVRRNMENPLPKSSKTPDIMGRSQTPERQSPPNNATQSQPEKRAEKAVTFANEIPREELDQVFGSDEDELPDPDPDIDYEDEETELMEHRSNDETVSATGVSFDELQTATQLLQKDELQADEQKAVAATAAKLAQTDLWDKIVEALPDANDKIGKMLDTSPQKIKTATDWQRFDIRDFI